MKLKKETKTMTYWKQDYTLPTFGAELEYYFSSSACQSIRKVEQTLYDAGFTWLDVKPDGTVEVDVEIVTPPLPDVPQVWADLSAIMEICKNLGLKYRKKCGLHIHIGKKRLKPAVNIDAYIEHVKQRASGVSFLMPSDDWFAGDDMSPKLVKDVIRRYATHQDAIDDFMPVSRGDNSAGRDNYMFRGMARAVGEYASRFDACQTISDLRDFNSIGRSGKYNAVNLETWNKGTIEFRQHPSTLSSGKVRNWVRFLVTLIETSDCERVNYGQAIVSQSAPVETETSYQTPATPYRRGSNIGMLYGACRVEGGATVRQLMSITGMGADNIRARISEIRNAIGQDAVITYTQQQYNHRYGASGGSHDLGGYEILQEVTRREIAPQNAVEGDLLPSDIIGSDSIWHGLPYDIVQYFQAGRVTSTRL